ncbi:MAG: calcium/proton exchanger [Cyclobacteriaceae bacterium]|nr:calcium/proton exchanger [Cyclobacteriaceae bacterium]MDX5467420.1 calcium/proton exchanger [Cyclobacteriaceae bacterium]
MTKFSDSLKTLGKPGIHWLFAFIPLTLYFEFSEATAPLIFFSAAISIIPIARLISTSTENLASYTGDAVGGLLNSTFGNLPELIIAVVALKAGLYSMVLASLAGAILANLLLALGLSFLVGGLKFHYQEYNSSSIRMYSSMMMIAVLSLTVPSAFNRFFGSSGYAEAENSLNIYLSLSLLMAYGLYLVFMLKTHPDFFKSQNSSEEEAHESHWSLPKSIGFLIFASVLAAFMSEILIGAAEETGEVMGMSSVFIGVVFLAVIGGAAESISAIVMASKNKVDLSIGIALGSSIQVALFIAPILVLLSLFIGPDQMNLTFNRALIGALFLGVILASMIANDGRSNWYKGVQLIFVYLILGMMFYFIPETAV